MKINDKRSKLNYDYSRCLKRPNFRNINVQAAINLGIMCKLVDQQYKIK